MTSRSVADSSALHLSAVENRLAKFHMQAVTAVAVVAALIVLVGDSQALTLIPLTGTMAQEYGLTAAQSPLILSILGIVGAGAIPVLTRVGERVSLRWFLIIGLLLSTLGNLLCAVAPGFTLLFIGRAVLGLSAAAPISLALIREKSVDVHGTNRGMGLVTAAVGVGVAISFLLGGVILQLHGTVHTVFWIMTLLALVSLLGAWILVPDFKVKSSGHIDYLGGVLLIVGLTAAAVAISYGTEWGWTSGLTLSVLGGGVVFLIAWVWIELVVPNPMVNLRKTFRRTTVPAFFIAGLLVALAILSNLAVTAFAEFEPIPKVPGLDYGYGHTVLIASLFLMPTALFIVVIGFAFKPFARAVGIKNSLIISGALSVVAFGFLALWHTEIWQNLVGMGIWGLAYGIGSAAAGAAYLHAAKDTEASEFAAASMTVTSMVSSFGPVVFSVVLLGSAIALPLPTGPVQVPTATSYTNEWIAGAIGGAIVLILALVYKKTEYQGSTGAVAVIKEDAAGIVSAAAE